MPFEMLLSGGAAILKMIQDQKKNIQASKGVLASTEIQQLNDQMEEIHRTAMAAVGDLKDAIAEAEAKG